MSSNLNMWSCVCVCVCVCGVCFKFKWFPQIFTCFGRSCLCILNILLPLYQLDIRLLVCFSQCYLWASLAFLIKTTTLIRKKRCFLLVVELLVCRHFPAGTSIPAGLLFFEVIALCVLTGLSCFLLILYFSKKAIGQCYHRAVS